MCVFWKKGVDPENGVSLYNNADQCIALAYYGYIGERFAASKLGCWWDLDWKLKFATHDGKGVDDKAVINVVDVVGITNTGWILGLRITWAEIYCIW